jgi:hypothetical protein
MMPRSGLPSHSVATAVAKSDAQLLCPQPLAPLPSAVLEFLTENVLAVRWIASVLFHYLIALLSSLFAAFAAVESCQTYSPSHLLHLVVYLPPTLLSNLRVESGV